MHDYIIYGCGGVGSWLAEFMARQDKREEFIQTLTLIDGDKVELKNLQRQNFTTENIGLGKVRALKDRLIRIGFLKTIVIRKMIDTPECLTSINPEAIALVTTDNIKSKLTIMNHHKKALMANCDYDFAEIKHSPDNTDKNAWQITNGYSSLQDIQSNIRAAQLLLTAICTKTFTTKKVKVQSELQLIR